jgi:lycopene cyclase CruP
MGHYSPIVKQQRHGQPVEGMVIVVGGCMTTSADDGAAGADQTSTSSTTGMSSSGMDQSAGCDLLVTIDDSQDDMQYFWEAFPAEGGKAKTVYMFAYADADPARPSMIDIFDTYLSNLERYQGVPLDQINWKRVLMGGFPCYSKHVPLKPAFDRVIQAGTYLV